MPDAGRTSMERAFDEPCIPPGHPRTERATNLGALQLGLPQGFRVEPKETWVHGGVQIVGDHLSIDAMNGHWSEESFSTGERLPRTCSARINGMPVTLVANRDGDLMLLAAWFQLGGEPYDPVLVIETTDLRDVLAFKQIVWSARRGQLDVIALP